MRNLILRNTPKIADAFELRTIESVGGKNVYELFCENGKIVLCGDCKISLAQAYYAYLKSCLGVNFSHCGNEKISADSAPAFDGKIRRIVPQKIRAYMDYGLLSYSCAFWKWEQWEKEIDFMAMNGINAPLSAVGTEAAWYYVLRDFKYSETGALAFLSGPCFWPQQLASRLSGYFALTDVKYIESRARLGKQIIDREVELGMTPIQQGFSGVVPSNIVKTAKNVRLRMLPTWNRFPMARQIDPLDPFFRKFCSALLEKQRRLFGARHYYLCEPFRENDPASKAQNYLWKVGRVLDSTLKDFDKDFVLVTRGSAVRERFLKAMPKDRVLILDEDGRAREKTENFWGYDFVLGSVHNRGDRTALYGDVGALADFDYASDAPENCVGLGIFTEGIRQNPLYYDLAFETLTRDGPEKLDEWLKNYAYRRYGSGEKSLADAVFLLSKSCYAENPVGAEVASTICARPSTELLHAAPNDSRERKYDNRVLFRAAEALLSAKNASKDGYVFDVCDVVRQTMSNLASDLYDEAMRGFRNKDAVVFERSANAFLKLCDDLDELLQTLPSFTLYERLKAAREAAFDEKEGENFELNLLTQITIWGPVSDPVLYDYAWKEWGGAIKTYYSKRWQSFFEKLAYEFKKRRVYSTVTRGRRDGRDAYRGSRFYKNYAEFERKWLSTANPEPPSGKNTLEAAKAALEKYRKIAFKL